MVDGVVMHRANGVRGVSHYVSVARIMIAI